MQAAALSVRRSRGSQPQSGYYCKTRYYGDMVYVCLAFNTRGKLRKQTTNCGGIVLTFDIHMSTPFGATSCAAQGQGHNGR